MFLGKLKICGLSEILILVNSLVVLCSLLAWNLILGPCCGDEPSSIHKVVGKLLSHGRNVAISFKTIVFPSSEF